MRILALSYWWPEPADNGIRLRIRHLLRALAARHEVHLVAMSEPQLAVPPRGALSDECASVVAVPHRMRALGPTEVVASLWLPQPASVRADWDPAFLAAVQGRAAVVRPDLIIAFELGTAPYACAIAGAPRMLEDLEITRIREQYTHAPRGRRRLRGWLTWQKHRSFVTNLLRQFETCTVASHAELADARLIAPKALQLAVIPNGADIDGCAGPWGNPEPDSLIYPGSLTYDANLDAMQYFLGAIYPMVQRARPGVRLRITGKTTSTEQARLPSVDGVELAGYVPDIRPVVARSWAEVVPLRTGSGTRLKVLEALALGTPVVSTSKGIEGLELDHGQHLLLADSADQFAAATARLLAEPELRQRLSAAGRQIVAARYDWRVIGQRLNDMVTETVERHRRQSRLLAA